MPDETITVTLPATDWPVVLSGLFELPGKFGLPVINRLQTAIADAQKPIEVPTPRVVGGKGEC